MCTVPKALAGLFSAIFIKTRVAGVEILAVEMVGRDPEAFAETLVVDDLPFPQEFQRIADIRVVNKAEQVVVRCTGLLLGCHILVHVADDIALALDIGRGPRRAGRGLRPDAGGMVDEIGIKTRLHDFLGGEVSGELMHHGGDHFKMCQFFGAYRSNGNVPYPEKR